MTFDLFLLGLLVTSTFTSLVTEAIKKIAKEKGKTVHTNTVTGIVTLILSTVIGIMYVLYTNTAFTAQIVVMLIALVFLSWLCAMVGYDKVIQAVTQITHKSKEDITDDEE